MSGINKIGEIEVKDDPYLNPISDVGIGFYNLDDQTAILRFHVTRDNAPLRISQYNAHTYVYLESENGASQIVEEVEYVDPLEGIVDVVIPVEFLQAASDSTVKGQIYIAVNDEMGENHLKSATATLSEFNFTVKNALINKIKSSTKIEYIKMFDDLKDRVNERTKRIDEALEKGEDYVTQVEDSTRKGLNHIRQLSQTSAAEINSLNERSQQTLQERLNAATQSLKQNTQNHLTRIDDKGSAYLKSLRTTMMNIQNKLATDGFVKRGDFDAHALYVINEIQKAKPQDTGWIAFELSNGATANRHYKTTQQNGFNTAYRVLKYPDYKQIYIRINADNFDSGEVIAQLPDNIVEHTHTDVIRTVPTKASGAHIVLEPTGDLKVFVSQTSEWSKGRDNYIYGELCFIE
ncbi:BppU family phage baseplate upper protein [Staphylococcus auricularis]|uniref:BppU family phage baseplate upper protein n=1 Tax=Staphylococcus auricularis TaxID=29379 RepID=UPI002432DB7D|nr:BppU family phage baseplate upper protein [Staphylococcus auricularis]